MAEKSKAERLVEAATSDKRVIFAEIALLGLASLAVYKKMNAGEQEPDAEVDNVAGQVINRHIEADGLGVDTFVHAHTETEEGTPFSMGIVSPEEGSPYRLAVISGVRDKASGAIQSLRISENLGDRQWSDRLHLAIKGLHERLAQESSDSSTEGTPDQTPLQA